MTTTTRLNTTPPAWAARTWDWSHGDPGEIVHEGQHLDLTAPDGQVVAEGRLSLILETGRTSDVTMVVAGGGFSSFPAASIPEFTKAVRDWADALDAEAVKLGGSR